MSSEAAAFELWHVSFRNGLPTVERWGHIVYRYEQDAQGQADQLNREYQLIDHYFLHRVTLVGEE